MTGWSRPAALGSNAPAAPRTTAPAVTVERPLGRRISVSEPMLGGRVSIHLVPADGDEVAATADATRALRRVRAWASHLTRFDAASDLVRLNDASDDAPVIRPTIAAVLDWARIAESITDGAVDVTLLDARLAAESGTEPVLPATRRWSLGRRTRGAIVRRPSGVRFDLDGVGKGWLADRALRLLDRHDAVAVDADGDVAVRPPASDTWPVAVADPRGAVAALAVLDLARGLRTTGRPAGGILGVATSGTSVHRWVVGGRPAHHLIDPRSGRPAATDVVQATVVSTSARRAEAIAKQVVLLGSAAARDRLERDDVLAVVALTDRDEVLVTERSLEWLA